MSLTSTSEATNLHSHDAPAPQVVSKAPEHYDTLLADYFRDVGALPVLQAQQEFEFASRIERLEIELWASILSYPQLMEPVLRALEQRLDERPSSFSQLRRACTAVRSTPLGTVRRRYDRWCENAARQIRALDVDREHVDLILEHLERLGRGETETLFKGARVSATSKTFKRHLQQVRRASRASRVARNEFVQANLRLVVTIARRFNFGHIPLNDLIQEGNIGLIKAVGRYDHRRGFRFSTYASWWIRHSITRAMADKGRLVRVPVHMLSTVQKVARVSRELNSKLGRAPTPQEIATTTSIEKDKVEQILEHMPSRSLSLDSKVNDDDDRSFLDMVQFDDERNTPPETIGDQQVYKHVQQIITELKPMEADILKKRFGLVDGEERTLVEIGASYELSRERIRQIQEQALGKIRRALRRRKAL